MGANLWDNYGIKVKRFYGGKLRGVCYRITVGDCQVDLTGQEFRIFMTETMAAAKGRD